MNRKILATILVILAIGASCLIMFSMIGWKAPTEANVVFSELSYVRLNASEQVNWYYNMSKIKSMTLDELCWSELERKHVRNILVIYGEWSPGIFPTYCSNGSLTFLKLSYVAKIFIPIDVSRCPLLVYARHTEHGVSTLSEELIAKMAERFKVVVMLYGEMSVDWESLGMSGRNIMVYYGIHALIFNDGRDLITGNFILTLAKAMSCAITLAQRICEKEGIEISTIAVTGGSKEGYATWLACTFDDRIFLASPGGFQMENHTEAIEIAEKQWGCYNPNAVFQPIEMIKLKNFLLSENGKPVRETMDICCRLDKLYPSLYIIFGDVASHDLHDGHYYALGAETNFLKKFNREWRYIRTMNVKESTRKTYERILSILYILDIGSFSEWPKVSNVEIKILNNSKIMVTASIQGSADKVYIAWATSPDKVWNAENVKWTKVEMAPVNGRYGFLIDNFNSSLEYAIYVEACKGVEYQGYDFTLYDCSPVEIVNELPPKKCLYDEKWVPGTTFIANRSMYSPGDIISVQHRYSKPPIEGGSYSIEVFYIEFWSEAHNGSKIGAIIYIPKGNPFHKDGWPLKVWLHGFGGPGCDYWEWPFTNILGGRGIQYGLAYASYGIVCIHPWVAGAGPSEPFAMYSPLTTWENAKVAFDAFKALHKLPAYMRAKGLESKYSLNLTFDYSREIMSTVCISSPTLMEFAHQYYLNKSGHPEVNGLKVMVADVFTPSVAYVCHCLTSAMVKMEGYNAVAVALLWAGPVWTLAVERGWDLRLFFKPEALTIFSAPIGTPVGFLPLMRASRLEPLEDSTLAPIVYNLLKKVLGREPTGQDALEFIFSDQMIEMFSKNDLEEILSDPFYRKYFARSDLFFEENVQPFNPGIPLLVVIDGDENEESGIVRSARYHAECMCLPRIETLKEWGWSIEYLYIPGEKLSASTGKGLTWTLQKLRDILYGQ